MAPVIVDLDYNPKDDIVLLLRLKAKKRTNVIESTAEVLTNAINVLCELGYVKIFEVHGYSVKVAVESVIIENSNIAKLISLLNRIVTTIVDSVTRVRIEDVYIPTSKLEHFKGPSYGISGIREILNTFDSPLIALKAYTPQIDLNLVDILIEDPFMSPLLIRSIYENFKKIPSKPLCISGLNSSWNKIQQSIENLHELGIKGIAVDITSIGWRMLNELRELTEKYGMLLYAYGTHWMKNEISKKVYTYLLRLIGFDLIDIGNLRTLRVSELSRLKYVADICRRTELREKPSSRMLLKEFPNLRPTMPMVNCKLDLELISKILRILGHDIVLILDEASTLSSEINEKIKTIRSVVNSHSHR